MYESRKVQVRTIKTKYRIKETLDSLPDVFAADLETTGLGHVSKEEVTHLSIGVSEDEAIVFIIQDIPMLLELFSFLVETDKKQIWHNASFDFRYIYYYTNKFPKNYEDTQQFAKCLLNHAESYKANTGLKELAEHEYGDWAISVDNFKVEQKRDEKVIYYAGVDSCATLWLWNKINKEVVYR